MCASSNNSNQERDCFQNSIALIMRLAHVPTFLKLEAVTLPCSDVFTILNMGGFFLKELPLYFEAHHNILFKPEMPSLLAEFLRQAFGVDLPWLDDPYLDRGEVDKVISGILTGNSGCNKKQKVLNFLPYLLLNPFNKDGVALHCVGLDCRYNRAIVWDPANVNSFAFTLQNLHDVCDGKWTPSFRHIWCLCSR